MLDKEHDSASDSTDVNLPSTSKARREELEEKIPQMELLQLPKIVRYNATSRSVEITQHHNGEQNRPLMTNHGNKWNKPENYHVETFQCMKHQQMENCQQPRIVPNQPASLPEHKNTSSLVVMEDNSNKLDLRSLTTERNFRKQQMLRILEELDEYRTLHRRFEEDYTKFKNSVCLTSTVLGAVVVAILFFFIIFAILYGNRKIYF